MPNNRSEVRAATGLTPSWILFFIFLVLKLTGVIKWSWWWVTAPLWAGLVLFAGILSIIGIVAVIAVLVGK